MVQNRLEQLARLAGRADDEPLAPLQDLRLRHDRHAAEVFEIAVGDQPVEVAQADGVFGEDDDVPRAAVHDLAAGAQLLHARVDGLQMVNALLLQHFEKAHEQIPAGDGVVGGAVVVEIGQTQRVRDDVELVFAELRHQILRQDERIDVRRLERDAEALARCRHEADIKIGVVRAQRPAADIVEKLRDRLGDIRLPGEHLVGDAGEVDDLRLRCGSTNIWKVLSTSLPFMMAAPISMIVSCRDERPVVSRSKATYSSSKEKSPSPWTAMRSSTSLT